MRRGTDSQGTMVSGAVHARRAREMVRVLQQLWFQ